MEPSVQGLAGDGLPSPRTWLWGAAAPAQSGPEKPFPPHLPCTGRKAFCEPPWLVQMAICPCGLAPGQEPIARPCRSWPSRRDSDCSRWSSLFTGGRFRTDCERRAEGRSARLKRSARRIHLRAGPALRVLGRWHSPGLDAPQPEVGRRSRGPAQAWDREGARPGPRPASPASRPVKSPGPSERNWAEPPPTSTPSSLGGERSLLPVPASQGEGGGGRAGEGREEQMGSRGGEGSSSRPGTTSLSSDVRASLITN